MLNRLQNRSRQAQIIRLVLAIALILGIVFRFAYLDRKIYWHDEAFSALRVSGYTGVEVMDRAFTSAAIPVTQLAPFQQPNLEKTAWDTVRSLALEDAQHPPLYYLLLRLWMQRWGEAIGTMRLFSVLTSLLVFPCLWLLCRELFSPPLPSHQVGWMAIALVAVSPFHVLYAQEAREYALWTVTIALSSWALLRALRLGTRPSWLLYGLTLVLGLYTYVLTALVMLGHGAYVVLQQGQRPRPWLRWPLVAYGLVSAGAIVAFLPWGIGAILLQPQPGASWTANPIPAKIFAQIWGLHLNRAFILTVGDFGFDHWSTYLALPLLLGLTVAAFATICRQTPPRTWLFILTLIGGSVLPLLLPDLILGGQRSTSSRYLIPAYLGLQLTVAYFLCHLLAAKSRGQRWIGGTIAAGVLTVGIISCGIAAPAEAVWTKVISYGNPAILRVVNAEPPSLLITNSFGINFGNILALSHGLHSDTQLQLIDARRGPDFLQPFTLPPDIATVFLLNPTDPFRYYTGQQRQTGTELVYSDFHLYLWRLSGNE